MKLSFRKDQKKNVSQSGTFSNIKKIFLLDKKIVLDIGCSEGDYLSSFGNGSIGVTIIEEHVRVARERGLNVLLKNVEDPSFSMDKKFDAIWANNLFEHMNSPHLFLVKMREQLKQGGVLILGVPVIPYTSWLAYFKKFRGAYAVSHVNFFTRKTLLETVKVGGWEIKEARPFYIKNRMIDCLFNLIAPHIYIVATPISNFIYPRKRLASLQGYK